MADDGRFELVVVAVDGDTVTGRGDAAGELFDVGDVFRVDTRPEESSTVSIDIDRD